MNERELIQLLTHSLASNETVRVGAGDDCAVLDIDLKGHSLLFKTDAIVEGIHFAKDTDPAKIGRKALARCLSDIAAMAGEPIAAVVTLALPPKFDEKLIEKIYEGINTLAREYNVAIVGGETVQNPERIVISVAMIGKAPHDKCTLRSGAKAGDALFVTGELGGSITGKHLEFEPRLKEARWLAEHFKVHAMIDLSDGLASDLRHMLDASRVGAELHSDSVPISREAKRRVQIKPPLVAALTDGEDFELLFTVASKDAVPLLDQFKQAFPGTRLTCIGKITAEPGLRIRDKQGVRPMNAHGYDHFQKPE